MFFPFVLHKHRLRPMSKVFFLPLVDSTFSSFGHETPDNLPCLSVSRKKIHPGSRLTSRRENRTSVGTLRHVLPGPRTSRDRDPCFRGREGPHPTPTKSGVVSDVLSHGRERVETRTVVQVETPKKNCSTKPWILV